jgi:hypothetical protein
MDDCMIRTKKFRRMISPFLFACWIDDQKFNRQRVSEILFIYKKTYLIEFVKQIWKRLRTERPLYFIMKCFDTRKHDLI